MQQQQQKPVARCFLAEIEKRRQLQNPAKLQLLLLRGANGMWTQCRRETILLPHEHDRFEVGVLVFLRIIETEGKRQGIQCEKATEEIVRSLLLHNEKIAEIKQQMQEIELWRDSLVFQSIELEKRKEALDLREDALKPQEEAMENFSRVMMDKNSALR